MNQIERIQYYEELLDRVEPVIRELDRALENYHKVLGQIEELEAYYDSSLWLKDYTADEEGKLPADLKRGVLSQDVLYNVLEDCKRIRDGLIIEEPDQLTQE